MLDRRSPGPFHHISVPRGVIMNFDQIVSVLGYAGDHAQAVRIRTTANLEVVGVPTSVDPDLEAHEVYLRPQGAEETEIAVSLAAIESVELVP